MTEPPTFDDKSDAPTVAERQELMRVCAQATEAELRAALDALHPAPQAVDVRSAESGLVMLRGRIGGSGAPFNVGEATVSRAVVRLTTGEIGYSHLLGRSKTRARLAAIIDGAGQNSGYRPLIERYLVHPVISRLEIERRIAREEAAATRVEFFTLVRGED